MSPLKLLLLLAAFTIGLILGNRTGRLALMGEMTEAFPEFFQPSHSEVNGMPVRMRGDCG